jgi:hydrogenase maturation protease
MSNLSNKTAIIGLGNTLRRDDGIGIHVLAGLQERFRDKGIVFLNFGITSFGLVNYISDFKKVLLIDAIDAGLTPATLKIFKINEAVYPTKENKLSAHELSLSDLLGLCNTLGISTDVHIAGIQVKDISYGLEMTKELKSAQSKIVDQIGQFIFSWAPHL